MINFPSPVNTSEYYWSSLKIFYNLLINISYTWLFDYETSIWLQKKRFYISYSSNIILD